MSDSDIRLQQLFAQYREACPDREPEANFMPKLWQKIDERQGFLFSFEHIAKFFAAASAVLCLLLLLLDYGYGARSRFASFSYPDALAANHSPEQTFFTEGLRSTAGVEDGAVH